MSFACSFTGGAWPRKGGRSLLGYAIPPPNVHSTDWRDMLSIIESRDLSRDETNELNSRKLSEPHAELNPPLPLLFSQMKFSESDLVRALITFLRCGCGRLRHAHIDIPSLTSSFLNHHGGDYVNKRREHDSDAADEQIEVVPPRHRGRRSGKLGERWSLKKHTICLPTNAFGTIEFQGNSGPHPHKAQYVRLSFDTNPALIISMFEEVWQIAPPKLIITVHGGTNNFDIQPKLARVFRRGLLRAATTTGAWIITSGVDTGVVRHVAAAFEGTTLFLICTGASSSSRNKVVCIGISPWGLLKKRDELIGEGVCVPYYPFSSKTRFTALNNRHSYFLLVDNGSVGRYIHPRVFQATFFFFGSLISLKC
uniref:LSDAT_euk domain-containing protein n=1 Tax=Angiostrongylus cantonensis TaxID=6313 RepID=A0A0K0DGZ5_ANGCA